MLFLTTLCWPAIYLKLCLHHQSDRLEIFKNIIKIKIMAATGSYLLFQLISSAFYLQLSTSSGKESQNSASSQPLRGLASLAANLTKPSSSKADSKANLTGWKTEATKPSHKDSSDKASRSESSKLAKGDRSGSPLTTGSSSSSGKGGAGNGSSGKTQPSMSGSAMANANKRLQQMKKAAAKQQEKRVHVK